MAPPDAPGTDGAKLEVDPVAVELGERFRAAGYQLYLVGGAVRDLLLGREASRELDFATDAHPEDTLKVLRGWAERRYLQGIRFGTVGAWRKDRQLEVTTFRQEVYPENDRHPNVTFADELDVDLSRRDFTVNAMAVRLPEREFVDPYGGVRDLAGKLLDTPLEPEVSFEDDPLRMLRACRFAAAFELAPAPRVVEAMRRLAPRLAIVSAERIRDELSKMLVAAKPSLGLELMVATGVAEEVVPELPALQLEQDPVHKHKDVLRHTMAVIEGCEPDETLRLAALLHDVGKPATRAYTPEGVQFHHHEMVGARMAERRLRALRYPNDVVADVVKLVEMHLRFHTFRMGWSDAAVRRYVRDAGALLDRLNQLTRADATTANPFKKKALAELQDELELRIAKLAEEENLAAIRPLLDGEQVMKYLGLEPGPLVGKALAFLLEARMEHGPTGQEEAYRLLDGWAREEGITEGP